MNTSKEAGTPRTIDSAGNIIPKPYGVSRWSSPRVYTCSHPDCDNSAVSLKVTSGHARNCCNTHEEGAVR